MLQCSNKQVKFMAAWKYIEAGLLGHAPEEYTVDRNKLRYNVGKDEAWHLYFPLHLRMIIAGLGSALWYTCQLYKRLILLFYHPGLSGSDII